MDSITNDGLIEISTGESRKETSWKNSKIWFSNIVDKLSKTHRTHETVTEYSAAKKSRQDEIKDIGGFVGGYLTKGQRKAANVLHRQLITLDVDFANRDFWFDFTIIFDCAAVLHSTHKHTPAAPRLRLIIPVSRELPPVEYEAVSRFIAGEIGIDLFDDSTFQPERLMYWPSTSIDGEYVFEYQDGPWLDVDEILTKYRNWQDSSEWPISSRVSAVIKRNIVKQGDPLEKPGLVGAFCRCYTIHDVIEKFLADDYEPCTIENRYTYKHGSTAAGLVVYDDKFAYSHHSTDPTSGKLCNAFDLVRLHKFHLKDEEVRDNTPVNKLPSYAAMLDLCADDPLVKVAVINEKEQNAANAFKDVSFNSSELTDNEQSTCFETLTRNSVDDSNPADDSWKKMLDMDRKKNICNTIDNNLLILKNDPDFKNRIAYDDFEKCEVAVKNLPWRKVDYKSRRLTDKDDANIRHRLEKRYGLTQTTKTRDALLVLAGETSFHPVRDYLKSLQWDGINRCEKLLIDYMGADDNEFVREVTKKFLVAAVSRVFNPGCKYDYMLVLVGPQGLKKSTLFAKLGGLWFSDSFTTIKTKEAFEQLQGVWIVEIAELAGFAKADIESIKHFITKQHDRYRVAYGTRTENFPRQCVFVGTTNKQDFLKDPSGDRRYWPVEINVIEPTKNVTEMSPADVAQIWAEAMQFHKAGENLYLSDNLEKFAEKRQADHKQVDAWTSQIENFLDTKLPEDWHRKDIWERQQYLQNPEEIETNGVVIRDRVCVQEIWTEALGKRLNDIETRHQQRIADVMLLFKNWDLVTEQIRFGKFYGKQRRGYKRKGFEINTDDDDGGGL